MTSGVTICITVILLAWLGHMTNAKTVVLFSPPHAANVRTVTNTGRALAAMGHDAYVPIPDFMLKDKSADVRGIHVIAYGEYLGHMDDRFSAVMMEHFWTNHSMGLGDVMNLFSLAEEILHKVLSDQDLIAKFKEIKPDMFVIFSVPPFKGLLLLPYMLDTPFTLMATYVDFFGAKIPISLSASPVQINGEFQEYDMSFFQRLKNSLMHFMFFFMHEYFSFNSPALVAKYAPNRPKVSLNEIMSKAEMFIFESDHIMDFARPQLPNTKFVGSTAGNPPRELKEPFKSFMEKSQNGVVVVTFGSSIVELPEYVSSKMASAFRKLKQNVIWRVKLQSPDPSKILTSSWIPQNDLLGHKNTKLFVSHCGMNGQYEGMYHAVPTLCLPLCSDQFYDAQRGVVKGFGLQADIRTTTETELLALMREIMDNGKYKKNIQKASDLYKELFKLPVNESAYWLDHVMKYGGTYMRSAGQNMPMYQFLSLDVLAFFALVGVVVVVLVYKTCRCCWGLCCGKKSKSKRD